MIKCVELAAEDVRGHRNGQEGSGLAEGEQKTEGRRLPLAFSTHRGKYHALRPLSSVRPTVCAKSRSVRSVTGDQAAHCNFSVKTHCISHLVLLLVAGHQPTAQCIWAPTHTQRTFYIHSQALLVSL